MIWAPSKAGPVGEEPQVGAGHTVTVTDRPSCRSGHGDCHQFSAGRTLPVTSTLGSSDARFCLANARLAGDTTTFEPLTPCAAIRAILRRVVDVTPLLGRVQAGWRTTLALTRSQSCAVNAESVKDGTAWGLLRSDPPPLGRP